MQHQRSPQRVAIRTADGVTQRSQETSRGAPQPQTGLVRRQTASRRAVVGKEPTGGVA